MADNPIRGILSDPKRQQSSARAVARHMEKMLQGSKDSPEEPGRAVDQALGRSPSSRRASGPTTRIKSPGRVNLPKPATISSRDRDSGRARRRAAQARGTTPVSDDVREEIDRQVSDPDQRAEVLKEVLAGSGDLPRNATTQDIVKEAMKEAEANAPEGVGGAGGASTGFGKRAFLADYERVSWDPEIPYPQIDPTRTTNEERPRTIAAGYDPNNSILRVTFRNGRVYEYLDVPGNIWQAFQRTPSPGKLIYTVLDQYFYREVYI